MTNEQAIAKLINTLEEQVYYSKNVEYAIGEVYSPSSCIQGHIYSTVCSFIEELEAIRDELEDTEGARQHEAHQQRMKNFGINV